VSAESLPVPQSLRDCRPDPSGRWFGHDPAQDTPLPSGRHRSAFRRRIGRRNLRCEMRPHGLSLFHHRPRPHFRQSEVYHHSPLRAGNRAQLNWGGGEM